MIPAFVVGAIVIGVLLDLKPGGIAVAVVIAAAIVGFASFMG